MRRTALLAALLVVVSACSPADTAATSTTAQPAPNTTRMAETTTTAADGFPVGVEADHGTVTIEERPEAIVSLSAVATEMLFEIGAGPQVVAVDDQSNYPPAAPISDLSGFTPNLEAILSYEPDLVVITFDPGDLIAGLGAAGVPVLSYTAAQSVDDTYSQIEALGAATGNLEAARTVNDGIESGLVEILNTSRICGEGVTYYHEIDSTLYTATSSTFFGEIYGLFGMVNIADEADPDGSAFGYPQLSSEYVVDADPDIIFLSNTLYGESAETVGARPGWDAMTAIQGGNIVELDSDVASRWGPRIIDFAQSISDALRAYHGG